MEPTDDHTELKDKFEGQVGYKEDPTDEIGADGNGKGEQDEAQGADREGREDKHNDVADETDEIEEDSNALGCTVEKCNELVQQCIIVATIDTAD